MSRSTRVQQREEGLDALNELAQQGDHGVSEEISRQATPRHGDDMDGGDITDEVDRAQVRDLFDDPTAPTDDQVRDMIACHVRQPVMVEDVTDSVMTAGDWVEVGMAAIDTGGVYCMG